MLFYQHRKVATMRLATSLARPALGADATGAGANHLVTTAMGTDDVHEHITERFFHPLCVGVAAGYDFRAAFARGIARDHIDQFFFSRSRQLRHGPIDRFLLHLCDFFER